MLPSQSLITFCFSLFYAILHSDLYPENSNLTSSEKPAYFELMCNLWSPRVLCAELQCSTYHIEL